MTDEQKGEDIVEKIRIALGELILNRGQLREEVSELRMQIHELTDANEKLKDEITRSSDLMKQQTKKIKEQDRIISALGTNHTTKPSSNARHDDVDKELANSGQENHAYHENIRNAYSKFQKKFDRIIRKHSKGMDNNALYLKRLQILQHILGPLWDEEVFPNLLARDHIVLIMNQSINSCLAYFKDQRLMGNTGEENNDMWHLIEHGIQFNLIVTLFEPKAAFSWIRTKMRVEASYARDITWNRNAEPTHGIVTYVLYPGIIINGGNPTVISRAIFAPMDYDFRIGKIKPQDNK